MSSNHDTLTQPIPKRIKSKEKEKDKQEVKKKKELPKWKIGIGYSVNNASRYFDKSGKEQSEIPDSLMTTFLDTISTPPVDTTILVKRPYNFEFTQRTFLLSAEYAYTSKLRFEASLPISYYSYTEAYSSQNVIFEFPELGINRTYVLSRSEKENLSRFRIDYLHLGTRYIFIDGFVKMAAVADIMIPTGFDEGQFVDEFLSDGAFMYNAGTNIEIDLGSSALTTGLLYNGRTEDFSDNLLINGGLALRNIPGTELFVNATYLMTFEDIDKARDITLRYEQVVADALNIGVGFKITFEKKYFAELGYNLTASGRNAGGFGGLNIKLGIYF